MKRPHRFAAALLCVTALSGLPALASAAGAPPAAAPAAQDEAGMRAGRELARLFLAADIEALWPRLAPAMQEALKDKDAFAGFRAQVGEQLGTEEEVLAETTQASQGLQVYVRTGRWSRVSLPIVMQWAIDADGRVAGFYIRPATSAAAPAHSPHADYRTKAPLRLPFEGQWFVFWGGRTPEQNHHVAVRDQRFAYDLLKTVDGRTHRGDGKTLSDYYCWNEKILAPAAATVVASIDGLPDQAIGTTNAAQAAGNHVVLDLGQGEYAVLAHLRQGSVRVKAGDTVAAGGELGRCGNSGNTSEPHLHFQLQDDPRLGRGDGLPAYFRDFIADGRPVAQGELLRGQQVSMP